MERECFLEIKDKRAPHVALICDPVSTPQSDCPPRVVVLNAVLAGINEFLVKNIGQSWNDICQVNAVA